MNNYQQLHALDLTSAPLGIIELKLAEMWTSLTYLSASTTLYRFSSGETELKTLYKYEIGGLMLKIDNEELHNTLLNARTTVSMLILEVREYQLPVFDDDYEHTGEYETRKSLSFVTIISIHDMPEYENLKRTGIIRNYFSPKDESVESDDSIESIERGNLIHSNTCSSEDCYTSDFEDIEPDDMDETDPTWRIANDLG